MATQHRTHSGPVSWELLALLKIAVLALLETLWGLISWPFVRITEEVALTYIPTGENQELIAGCPALKIYSCSPWATGPHAQTFFSVIRLGPRPMPRKELVTMPDGVQITLLWFEPKDAAADAPLVISLHGIGGDENSVRPIVLAEECLRQGWRSVLYVRRGHGNSSLLPVGAAAAAATATATTEAAAASRDDGCKAVSTGAAIAAAGPTAAVRKAGSGGGAKGPLAAAVEASATAAVPSAASAAAAACLDFPSPPASPAAARPAVTIAAIATDGAGATATAAAAGGATSGCLAIGLPLPGRTAGAPAAATSPEPDPEALRRTRKAFPQHVDTEDFQVVLQHIRGARPQALMVAVGFSMGSNVLVKFLGEHPPPGHAAVHTTTAATTTASTATAAAAAAVSTPVCGEEGGSGGQGQGQGRARWLAAEDPKNPLAAAISVSNGYDIIEGTRHLVSSRPLADRIITGALHKLLRRRLPEVHAICAAHGVLVDFDEVLSCNTIRDFERALMLPICGLNDLDDYYSHNNCREALMNVRTPLLCMSAADDPIIDPALLRHAQTAAAANPHVLLALTRRGGHLGWMQGWSGRSWMIDVIVQFVQSVVQQRAAAATAAAASFTEAKAPQKPAAAAATSLVREPRTGPEDIAPAAATPVLSVPVQLQVSGSMPSAGGVLCGAQGRANEVAGEPDAAAADAAAAAGVAGAASWPPAPGDDRSACEWACSSGGGGCSGREATAGRTSIDVAVSAAMTAPAGRGAVVAMVAMDVKGSTGEAGQMTVLDGGRAAAECGGGGGGGYRTASLAASAVAAAATTPADAVIDFGGGGGGSGNARR